MDTKEYARMLWFKQYKAMVKKYRTVPIAEIGSVRSRAILAQIRTAEFYLAQCW